MELHVYDTKESTWFTPFQYKKSVFEKPFANAMVQQAKTTTF